jgi:riboflavin synthase
LFTGIVQSIGSVEKVQVRRSEAELTVSSDLLRETSRGDSVCICGVCLTVAAKYRSATATFQIGPETLRRTTLGGLRASSPVNLELPLQPDGRIGGHFVQGHVDCLGTVVSRTGGADFTTMEFALQREYARYIVEEGFVAVDGVSLTARSAARGSFCVALIPTTLQDTTLGLLQPQDRVNIEVDILAKYVERFVGASSGGGVTLEKLGRAGFFSR